MGAKGKLVRFYSTVSDRSEVVHLISKLFSGDGGPGSGNFGHSGRPGEIGGSGGSGGSASSSEAESLKKQIAGLSRFGEQGEKRKKLTERLNSLVGKLENKPKSNPASAPKGRVAYQLPETNYPVTKHKEDQFRIIQENNPMLDDYHVGIRKPSDIMSPEEAFGDEEGYVYPDFTKEDGQKALSTGFVTVYSSKHIRNGNFVTPSKMLAGDYAGDGQIYSQKVPVDSVAWINAGEGQFADVKSHANDGGPGSGNFNHSGRPGKVGGSGPGGGAGNSSSTPGLTEPSEMNKEFSGMSVKTAMSIKKKAEAHPKVYDDWAGSLTAEEAHEIEDQYHKTHDNDPSNEESVSGYYERIWRTLSADAKIPEMRNKPVSGKDITDSYESIRAAYTEPKFGQVIDTEIEDVIEKQGFNGVPKIVPKDEFDKYIDEHPEAPIMFRTYSAPNMETLEQYDKDLEKGAWYVDCGIGGSKYGQGMYTAAAYPWKIDDLTSIYRNGISSSVERGAVFSGASPNGEKEVYQIASENPSFTFDGGEEGKTYAFFSREPSDCMVVTKKNGKLVDRMMGYKEYGENDEVLKYGYDTVCEINILPKEELLKRDIERPLEQMREYIQHNERREGNKDNPEEIEYVRKIQALEVHSKSAFGGYKEKIPRYLKIDKTPTADATFYMVDEETEPLTKEKFDSLEPGKYVMSYDDELTPGYRSMVIFRVEQDGTKRNESIYLDVPIDEKFEKHIGNNPQVNKCEDITPKKPDVTPKTSTRKMTLDPSANMITYEKLRDMYYDYQKDHASEKKNRDTINAIAEAESFTEEQKEAFDWFMKYERGMLPGEAMYELNDHLSVLGGRENARRLYSDYFDKYNSMRVDTIDDISAYAAAKGYDAVVCSNYGRTIVVLNRTKLILSDEHVEVPREEAS